MTPCGAFRPQGLCIIAEQGVKLLRENQRHYADKAGATVLDALHLVQQAVDVRGEVMVLAGSVQRCISGRINARGAAKCIHNQAAVICKAGQACQIPEILHFDDGIFFEGAAGLLDIHLLFGQAQVVRRNHLDTGRPEDLACFAEFAGVAGGEYQFQILHFVQNDNQINGLESAVRRASS